jgi:phosphoadenosine phosphosulfate reductase
MLRYGLYRPADFNVPAVRTAELYNYVRSITGNYWIAGGERINDSIVRRAMIKHSGSIDEKRGRFYPLAEWGKRDALDYIRKNHLKIGEESAVLGFSFRSFDKKTLAAVKERYPEDFELIQSWFPFCAAGLIEV